MLCLGVEQKSLKITGKSLLDTQRGYRRTKATPMVNVQRAPLGKSCCHLALVIKIMNTTAKFQHIDDILGFGERPSTLNFTTFGKFFSATSLCVEILRDEYFKLFSRPVYLITRV